jgi:hypothetical protein
MSDEFLTNPEDKMKDMLDHLKTVSEFMDRGMPEGFAFSSLDATYLHHCRPFSHEPYTDEEKDILLEQFSEMRFVSKQKECYATAARLALYSGSHPDVPGPLSYADGKANGKFFPMAHAWAVINGKPVDITWREPHEGDYRKPEKLLVRAERNLASNAYFGVDVPLMYLRGLLVRNEVYTSVFEDYQGGQPLCKSKEVPWAEMLSA